MAALKLISPVRTSSEAHALFQNAGGSTMMEQKLKAARIMKKLLQNIVDQPGVDKYRRLRTNNEKLQKDVWPCRGSWDIMLCAGFTVVDELFEGDGGGAGVLLGLPPRLAPPPAVRSPHARTLPRRRKRLQHLLHLRRHARLACWRVSRVST